MGTLAPPSFVVIERPQTGKSAHLPDADAGSVGHESIRCGDWRAVSRVAIFIVILGA